MKILVVDPGADWSTADVYLGLVAGLRACGHEVVEFRYGRKMEIHALGLMAAWRKAKRRGVERERPTTADAAYLTSEAVVAWALRHEPDWTLVVSGMFFHPDALILARRAGLRTAILLTESPYDFEKERVVAALADVVWTNERTAVAPLRAVNPRARYLPHGFNPARHGAPTELDAAAPAHDVAFIGTGFMERVELLGGVDWAGIDLGLYGAWPILPRRSPLRACVKNGITDNRAAAAIYRRAKVNLNLFRTSAGFGRKAPRILGAESLGPRAYELAACGAFFVSERRAEVGETFGDLVPTFEGPGELQELLARWIPDEPGRTAVRRALPAAVRGHSWAERARQVVADLADATAGRGDRPTGAAAEPPPAATCEPSGMGALAIE